MPLFGAQSCSSIRHEAIGRALTILLLMLMRCMLSRPFVVHLTSGVGVASFDGLL